MQKTESLIHTKLRLPITRPELVFRPRLQVLVPDALRGRVLGILSSTINLTTLISMAAGGALADLLGIREVFALAGLAIVAGGVLAQA